MMILAYFLLKRGNTPFCQRLPKVVGGEIGSLSKLHQVGAEIKEGDCCGMAAFKCVKSDWCYGAQSPAKSGETGIKPFRELQFYAGIALCNRRTSSSKGLRRGDDRNHLFSTSNARIKNLVRE